MGRRTKGHVRSIVERTGFQKSTRVREVGRDVVDFPGNTPHIMPVMGGVVVTSSVELTLSSGVSLRLVLHQGVERFGSVAVLGTVVG